MKQYHLEVRNDLNRLNWRRNCLSTATAQCFGNVSYIINSVHCKQSVISKRIAI